MAILNGFHPAEPALAASRGGQGLCLKVNDKAGVNGADTVLTDAGFLYAIPAGQQVVVTCFYMYVSTASDWLWVEIGYTPAADGSGTFVPVTPKFRIDTGATVSATFPHVTPLHPPIVLKYSAGVCMALSARVRTNDAGATFTLTMNGWHERIQ